MQPSNKNENENGQKTTVPILVPIEPEVFWSQMRILVRDELTRMHDQRIAAPSLLQTSGLIEKPLYKMQEICELFKISKPTVYDWIKHGKLKPQK